MGIVRRVVPSFVRKRYVMKFVVSFVAVVLVIGAIGAVSYTQVDGTVKADTTNQLESTARLHADTIGEWLRNMRVKTRMVSAGAPLGAGDAAESGEYLRGALNRLSVDVRAIHYVDLSDASVPVSTEPQFEGTSLDAIDAPWATAGLSDRLSFENSVWNTGSTYESSVVGDQVMAFASPVAGRDGRAVVLVGTLERRVDALYQPLSSQATRIVDPDGTTVLRTGGGDGSVSVDGQSVSGVADGGVSVEESNGTLRAYAAVGRDTDWVAVTAVPTETAFAVRSTVGWNVLAIVLSALLMLGVVGVVLGRQTVTPLVDLRDKSRRMEQGDLGVDLATDRTDEIGQLYAGFAEMRDALRTRIEEAQQAREEAERARAETEAINDHLERKADEYSEVMSEVGNGDLTRRMDPDSESEAMTAIAERFNRMVAEVEETTAQQKRFAREVATASEEVDASIEEVRSASQKVTESIQEISDGAERQDDALQSVSEEMNGLSTTIEEIASLSNQVADLSERTAETGREGRAAAEAAIEGMDRIEEESRTAVERIRDLDDEMEQISELTAFVADVADKTNRLALNANIEASRAGAGDGSGGFEVVAGEIKDLAAETREATEHIEESVDRIQGQAGRAVESVTTTGELIQDNADSVRNAIEALDEIAEYAQETNTGVQEISAATEQQAASTQQVVAMVDEAAGVSRETTAESQTVAAAAEEQTNAVDEVSRSTDSLTRRATQLSESLDDFETDADGDPRPSIPEDPGQWPAAGDPDGSSGRDDGAPSNPDRDGGAPSPDGSDDGRE